MAQKKKYDKPGRPKEPRRENLFSERVVLQFTPLQKEIIRKHALARGGTITEYFRDLLENDLAAKSAGAATLSPGKGTATNGTG